MEQTLKYKFYKPISQEKIEEAVKELNRERNEFLDIESLIGEDKFVIIYRDGNKTLAPEKDIVLHSNISNPNNLEEASFPIYENEDNDWMTLAREYWFIAIPAVGFLIWIFGKYWI